MAIRRYNGICWPNTDCPLERHYEDDETIACAAGMCLYLQETELGLKGSEIQTLMTMLGDSCRDYTCGRIPTCALEEGVHCPETPTAYLIADYYVSEKPDCEGLC